MKTTIELSDTLFEQAKTATRTRGITLKSLVKSGLHMAIHPDSAATQQAAWPDLTFHPQASQAGYLIALDQWREAANPCVGLQKQ